jgi:hypothetical protein
MKEGRRIKNSKGRKEKRDSERIKERGKEN